MQLNVAQQPSCGTAAHHNECPVRSPACVAPRCSGPLWPAPLREQSPATLDDVSWQCWLEEEESRGLAAVVGRRGLAWPGEGSVGLARDLLAEWADTAGRCRPRTHRDKTRKEAKAAPGSRVKKATGTKTAAARAKAGLTSTGRTIKTQAAKTAAARQAASKRTKVSGKTASKEGSAKGSATPTLARRAAGTQAAATAGEKKSKEGRYQDSTVAARNNALAAMGGVKVRPAARWADAVRPL